MYLSEEFLGTGYNIENKSVLDKNTGKISVDFNVCMKYNTYGCILAGKYLLVLRDVNTIIYNKKFYRKGVVQLYKIVNKRALSGNIFLMDVEAKRSVKSAKPGQFLIVRIDSMGERIPLTICDMDKEKGLVTIVFQTVGDSTNRMAKMEVGDYFSDLVCPLGNPTDLCFESDEELKDKDILFIAGGVGTAPVYPQVKYMKERGFDVDVIIGAKNKDAVIMEEEMRKVAKNVYVCTDDGSYGFKGLVTDCFKDLMDNQGKKYNHVVAIGPMIMMKFAALATKEYGIKTVVSLNPIMVDGTGMCGACRVSVGDSIKFACVDGPEFDGHEINFDEAMRRQKMYKTEEGRKLLREIEKDQDGHEHSCGCGGK